MDDEEYIRCFTNIHVDLLFGASHIVHVQLRHIRILKWVISASLSGIVSPIMSCFFIK